MNIRLSALIVFGLMLSAPAVPRASVPPAPILPAAGGTPASSRECPLASQAAFTKGVLTITRGSRVVRLRVEVAETPAARAQGLMCRTRLDADAGMLFIFEETTRGSFWMKNTLIPLSIAFIDETWRIVEILDMEVERDPATPVAFYSPKKAYRYALEVNRGFFVRHNITAGASVTYRPQP
ncbi:MAG: DUF192 domain-containing protein [Armatimonadota bacterium]|nr:DUF192 domain-containing protein [Armatimonadota bacterium]MDR7451688.1 DUF192 domain-containing protein [Armatimonadota bacterium]MDR7465694.1 DUF192 domain-containing protein [Armatimonadota bacterium]MDR7493603.1 DUF192 domain-containing protein [Armatimonadota bacterium]MDR7499493.1 DUF192 domain-containing protein [Armatimonadota bacterium]